MILLIDDNAVQAAARQAILKRAGYVVIAVLSPQRALEQFRNSEFPGTINLVITDHIMPGMSGAQFCGTAARVRTRRSRPGHQRSYGSRGGSTRA